MAQTVFTDEDEVLIRTIVSFLIKEENKPTKVEKIITGKNIQQYKEIRQKLRSYPLFKDRPSEINRDYFLFSLKPRVLKEITDKQLHIFLNQYFSKGELYPEYSKNFMDKVVLRCKECIKHDGYVRIGYVLNEMEEKEEFSFYTSVASTLTNTGRYKSERIQNNESKSDYYIIKDSSYQLSSFQKTSVITAIIFAVATIVVQIRQCQISQQQLQRDQKRKSPNQ